MLDRKSGKTYLIAVYQIGLRRLENWNEYGKIRME